MTSFATRIRSWRAGQRWTVKHGYDQPIDPMTPGQMARSRSKPWARFDANMHARRMPAWLKETRK